MSELLLKITSNKVLAADLRPSELLIYDDKVVFKSNVGIVGGEEAEINYDDVAEVNVYRGLIQSKVEIINHGGADDILMEHVRNAEAAKAKEIIEARARTSHERTTNVPDQALQDIEELKKLLDQGAITQAEFDEKKSKLMGQI